MEKQIYPLHHKPEGDLLMNTIPETLKRAAREGIVISECALRRWVADGSVHSVRAGRKILVNYESFLTFLNGGPK